MTSLREQVVKELEHLPDADLLRVADYVDFLKFRAAGKQPPRAAELSLACLYADFAERDRALAESGMADYANALEREDSL